MLRIYPVKTEEIKIAKQLFAEYLEFLKKELCEYADLPWLIDYYRDFEKEIDALPGRYKQPNGCILLATYNEQPAGCVALGSLNECICEMKRLYIKPEFRRKKLGTTLCRAVIEQAKKTGYTHLRLATALEPAKFLYKSLGFMEIPPYLYVPLENVLFMEFKLT
jgi:GNAT superfamily N-acetyltransferase